MEYYTRRKKRISPRIISLIITAAIILQLAIVGGAFIFKRTDLIRFINRNSIAVYERKSFLLPTNFKTITISNENSIGLGYSVYDGDYYYCIHGSEQFSRTFYMKDIKGNVTFSRNHTITMKAEIIFKEKDIQEGSAINGYVYFYENDYSTLVAELKAKMTVDKIYASRVSFKIENTLSTYGYFADYSDTGFETMGKGLLGECFKTFDNFLLTHDFERFHRSKFHPSRFD